jgi:cell division protein FtsQ
MIFAAASRAPSRRQARVWSHRVRRVGGGVLAALVLGLLVYRFHDQDVLQVTCDWLSHKAVAVTARVGFTVEDILLTGRERVAAEDILMRLDVNRGIPIFAVSLTDMQQRLSGMPWIRRATVTRRLPQALVVQIEERVPAAMWQYQKKLSLVDAEGKVLTDRNLDAYKSLPLVVGADAAVHVADLLRLLQTEPELAREFSSAIWVGGRRWDIRLRQGVKVRLPETGLEDAISRLAVAVAEHKILARSVAVIDLRLAGKMVVTPTAQPHQSTGQS